MKVLPVGPVWTGNPALLPILHVSHRRGSRVCRHTFPSICVIRKYVAKRRRNAPKGRLMERGLKQEEIVPGAEVGSMLDLLNWVLGSDKAVFL